MRHDHLTKTEQDLVATALRAMITLGRADLKPMYADLARRFERSDHVTLVVDVPARARV